MNAFWRIQTYGNPLETLQQFIRRAWIQAKLDGLIIPLEDVQRPAVRPQLIHDPADLERVNPFKPLMTLNAARLIPEMLQQQPEARLGALLRPCEMRALIEMAKRKDFRMNQLLTISVDCLGTFSLEDYQWRLQKQGSTQVLTQEALRFARQGGINAYQYRSACQSCSSPEADSADLNIHLLGLPVRRQMLVQARSTEIAERLGLSTITDGPAEVKLVDQHQRVVSRLKATHQQVMQRVHQNLDATLPHNVDELINHLEDCGACQACMEVCPICSVDFPRRGADNRFQRADVIRWLISCAGCGMCEQTCSQKLPLSAIFGQIREQLTREFSHQPGGL